MKLNYTCKQSDVQLIKRAMEKTGEEANGLMIKINELNLFNEKSDQELKKAKAIKQVQYHLAIFITLCVFFCCCFLKKQPSVMFFHS